MSRGLGAASDRLANSLPFTISASELAPATVEALEQCPRDSETGEMLLPMELLATLFIQRSINGFRGEA